MRREQKSVEAACRTPCSTAPKHVRQPQSTYGSSKDPQSTYFGEALPFNLYCWLCHWNGGFMASLRAMILNALSGHGGIRIPRDSITR